MADAAATKHLSFNGGILVTELRSLRSLLKSKRTVSFAYGFMFAFVLFTVFLAFSPSNNSSSPWFVNMFNTGAATATAAGSQFSSIFYYFSPNNNYSTGIASSQQQRQEKTNDRDPLPAQNATINRSKPVEASQTSTTSTIVKSTPTVNNLNQSTGDYVKPIAFPSKQSKNSSIVSEEPLVANTTTQNLAKSYGDQTTLNQDQTTAASKAPVPSNQSTTSISPANQTTNAAPKAPSSKDQTAIANSPTKSDSPETKNSGNQENSIPAKSVASNYTTSLAKKQSNATGPGAGDFGG